MADRTVVVLVRTLTSALRVHELLSFVFGGEHRIRLVYVFDDGSAFSGWLGEWSSRQGRYVLTRAQARHLRYHLVVSASENADFRRWRGPIIVVPHGLGNHKWVRRAGRRGKVLSGLPNPKILRKRRVTVLVTHPDQEKLLHRLCPDTIGRTVVVGDTSYAALLASNEARHIDRYRRCLGTGDRTLIMVMSTWGHDSVLGTVFGLLTRLLAELPMGEYQIGLAAHCNVWTRDGADELLRKLQDAMNAGLVLIRPEDWQAAMVAADVVISDHGSLALYAAMAGKPLLLASFSDSEVVKDTPMDKLGCTAPRLNHDEPLPPQVEAAIAKADPIHAEHIARTVVAPFDLGVQMLRTLFYKVLNFFPLRSDKHIVAAPDPRPIVCDVHSYRVTAEYLAPRVVISWTPWAAHERDITREQVPEPFLVSDERERDMRVFNNASVIVRGDPYDGTLDGWLEGAGHKGNGYTLAALARGPFRCEVQVSDTDIRHPGQRFELTSAKGILPFGILPVVMLPLMKADDVPTLEGTHLVVVNGKEDVVDIRRVR
ncbi:hypothetical protein [Actinocrispum wychmicini]|uniref:CDP-glycerol:poly(Glycerophosphate) glycerophosphotransferase n=1 Tax=Actinocrispum wychmicini TaxID=1213861 RepID=A0A4R2JK60_9PSEU|nr:hypothetical protein [Actinocrispum wychmicini]TCO59534.1 hypothetical protein EV192_104376 [Actinocrispum wychmicini]